MKIQAPSATEMEEACGALQKIAAANEKNEIIIAKEGGIPIVLNIMKMHASNEEVMEDACGALLLKKNC